MDDLQIVFDQPPPTSGGLYLAISPNTTEADGSRAMSAVWVFDFHGQLLFVPMGLSEGKPLSRYPWLEKTKWSRRLTVASPEQHPDVL